MEVNWDDWPFILLYPPGAICGVGDIAPDLIDPQALLQHQLLAPPVEKLLWATKHLTSLRQSVAQVGRPGPDGMPTDVAGLRARLDPASGYHLFEVSSLPDLAHLRATITHSVTDVANPLRAALDQFAWQLALDFSDGNPVDKLGVKFPITSSPQEWIKARRARDQMHPLHWSFIERFQPYHGRNGWGDRWSPPYIHPLAHLHRMTNDDKHRETHPAFLAATTFHLRHEQAVVAESTDGPAPSEVPDPPPEMNLGTEVLRVRLVSSEPEIQRAGVVAPHVVLPEGREVIVSMERIVDFVHLILSEFNRQFPAG